MKKWMIALILGSVSTVSFAQVDDRAAAEQKAKMAAEKAALAGNAEAAFAPLKAQVSMDCKADPEGCARLKREMELRLSNVREKINAEMSAMSSELAGAKFGLLGPVVKGAPYSAQSVTESIQLLHDGNRIVNRLSFYTYRDQEGRVARAEAPKGGGAPQVVYILDPVANVSFSLNPHERTARRETLRRPLEAKIAGVGQGNEMMGKKAPTGSAEPLGKRFIQGVEAEGTRTVTTIKAGDIGNERPIEIVQERWYSPELQTNVLTKRTDPRYGETIFQLLDLQRGEPARSYFEVPSDYREPQREAEMKRKTAERQ